MAKANLGEGVMAMSVATEIPSATVRPWLSMPEAADMLGVSMATLRRWCRDGVVPVHRLGPRLLRFEAVELRAWATEQTR
ncbi:MAG: helix-turn-helix domain-containing protein [Sulfobacillus sp.]